MLHIASSDLDPHCLLRPDCLMLKIYTVIILIQFQIRVGLKFLGNTTVTLRNPPSVDQAGSYSKVSLFFKTAAENALLLYAGSDRSGIGRANQVCII